MPKFEFQVESKKVDPQIYSILFINKKNGQKSLRIIADHDFTSAYDQGRDELMDEGFAQDENEIAIQMWATLSLEEVIEKVCADENQTLGELLHNEKIKIDKDELEIHSILSNKSIYEIIVWAWQEYDLSLGVKDSKPEQVQEFWTAYDMLSQNRDKLMRQLIRLNNQEKLEECKDYLEDHEYKYVKRKIMT